MQPRLDFRNYRIIFPKRESCKIHVDEDDTLKQGIIDNLGRKLKCLLSTSGQNRNVAEALRYINTSDALKTHVDDDDKAGVVIHDGSQNRNVVGINESGLYSLMLINKFSLAKEFKSWLYIKNIAINYYLSVLIAPLFPLLCLDSIRAKIMVEIV